MKDENEPSSLGSPGGGDDEPQVPEKAQELLEAARRRGRGLLDRQKDAAVSELHSVADVMRDAAHRFEERQEGEVGRTVERAAQYLDRISDTLRSQDLGELVRRGQQTLRERPVVALGATAVVGFMIGRILRASSRRIAERAEAAGGIGEPQES
jgi:ElaB/YqjD/DUF883 family membrane-anchored ribosome-binding protein